MKESESALALQSLRAAYALLLQDRDALRAQRDEWLDEWRERHAALHTAYARLQNDLDAIRAERERHANARKVIEELSVELYVARQRIAYLSSLAGVE